MRYLILYLGLIGPLFGCTDFLIEANNGGAVVGRSMEWGETFHTEVMINPRGQVIKSLERDHHYGMRWTSSLGYLTLMTKPNIVFDGLNEKGLSVGVLWFPDAEYPPLNDESSKPIVSFLDLPALLLGHCASVEDARHLLSSIDVYAFSVPMFKGVPKTHISVHDASGASLVVEYLDGKLELFDNEVGVLTNNPSFPWQVTNLANYVNLTTLNVKPHSLGKLELEPTGQGSGLLGIPGDWTPPSRFVRTALVKEMIPPPSNVDAAVLLAFHLLNMVDIPSGGVSDNGQPTDYTQWSVVKNLEDKVIHIRTYSELTPHTVSLKDEDLTRGVTPRMIPIPMKELER